MTERIAFATAPADFLGNDDTDRPLHESACAAIGLDLDYQVWSDPRVVWDDYDLVVVRSTWDYLDHLDAYRAWIGRMAGLGTLCNPAPVILWNLDKRYLGDLADAGVPVVPTAFCETAEAVAAALTACPGEVVVKPVVSAGSKLTGRFVHSSPDAGALALRILATGMAVLVQPAIGSVATQGEVSTLLFGGVISHSVRKGPLLALGGGLVGGTYAEHLELEVLTSARSQVVLAAATAVSGLMATRLAVDEPLLYARVDVVTLDDGSEAVLEVEVAEPAFFLATAAGSAERFAIEVDRRAVVSRLARAHGR